MFGKKEPSNKTIYVISLPRSNSTAILMAMQSRNDTHILNEPGVHAWQCNLPKKQELPELVVDSHSQNFSEFSDVAAHIKKLGTQKHVFVKEMAFAAKDYLIEDFSLLNNKDASFFFLIRSPQKSIISHYKKLSVPLDEIVSEVLSYQDMYRLYETISEQAKDRTFIISAEDLLDNPRSAIELFCENAGINFNEQMLNWPKIELSTEWKPQADIWYRAQGSRFSLFWHGTALNSNGFDKNLESPIQTDLDGKPTFEEIKEEHRSAYMDLYREQLKHYEVFMEKYSQRIKLESTMEYFSSFS